VNTADLQVASHPTARLVGAAPAMETLRAQIRRLATFDVVGGPLVPTLLLQGETGTGKGLVARVIHDSGPRAQGPFVEVNCAAIPDTMLEAELFGFEPGAFTDAKRAKPGLFEAASGGTLFLDEIDALPLVLQGKLLTAIEAKQVRRLGAIRTYTVDVKFITATNAALPACITAGRFRADLYHRLAVIVVSLPPLRERQEDVLLLAEAFLQQYTTAHGVSPKRLSAAAAVWLRGYAWPGNVRELGHVMERVVLLHVGEEVDVTTLTQLCVPLAAPSVVPESAATPLTGETTDGLPAEAAQIRQALAQTAGNVARAARLLGVSRDTVRYRMQRYGLARLVPDVVSPPPPGATSVAARGHLASPPASGPPLAWPHDRGEQQPSPARTGALRHVGHDTADVRLSTILIVDDDPFNVDYLVQELEELGYVTVSARNGREALEQVAAAAPDLILLDVMMPVMDGYTVCRLLKSDEETRLIPIVMLTALDGVEDRIKGIEAGADDFLSKPVHPQELLARIQTTLRMKHTMDRKLHALRRVQDHLATFVPETVKRLGAAHPEAPELAQHEQDISVLCLDLSGYARLSEQLPPDVLSGRVEHYVSTLLDRIHAAGGELNATGGDGLMAIFQDADACEHPRRAVQVALTLLGTTEACNRTNAVQPLAIHLGVHSGRALVGVTRFEGRRGTRWTFTASGPVTNLAAQLASCADAGEILVSAETARRLDGRYGLERLEHPEAMEMYRVGHASRDV
jgi:DNA-binding NtrC family response regulator